MHRAWDVLLWVLIAAVAFATAMAIVSIDGLQLFEVVKAVVVIGPVGLVAVGIVVALEATERGRQPRLASMVRWTVLAGAASAGLAVLLGSTRTSPLVQVFLLCAAFAACGVQTLTLGRLSLFGRWGRFARRVAITAGWMGVMVPVVLMASIGLVTWALAMVARGAAPLADEGALPFAETLGVVAVGLISILVMPLSIVAVACAALGTGTAAGVKLSALDVPIACPRCGDRRRRPFGQPWLCRGCGLCGTVTAPEMICACGTTLVGVAGDRCPQCGSAIRTRWGGPIAEAMPQPEAGTQDGRVADRCRSRVAEALTVLLLLFVPVAPLALVPATPAGDWSSAVSDWLLPVGMYCGILWGGMLVVIDALSRRRCVWLACVAGICLLTAIATWTVDVTSGMRMHPYMVVVTAATVLAVAAVGALVAARARTRGALERRLRRGTVLLAVAAIGLFAIQAGLLGSEPEGSAPGLAIKPFVSGATRSVDLLANWTACLAFGAGFVLVLVRRIDRRRQLRPRALGLDSGASLELDCPRCTATLRVPLRRRTMRCESCDLSIHISLTDGRCTCGQSLAGLSGDRCPECGRRIPEALEAGDRGAMHRLGGRSDDAASPNGKNEGPAHGGSFAREVAAGDGPQRRRT